LVIEEVAYTHFATIFIFPIVLFPLFEIIQSYDMEMSFCTQKNIFY